MGKAKRQQTCNIIKTLQNKRKRKMGKCTKLPFNSNEYSVAHPALSVDEKTLYFASDMPGTKGLSDLLKSINQMILTARQESRIAY
jgi:hypothetical protein